MSVFLSHLLLFLLKWEWAATHNTIKSTAFVYEGKNIDLIYLISIGADHDIGQTWQIHIKYLIANFIKLLERYTIYAILKLMLLPDEGSESVLHSYTSCFTNKWEQCYYINNSTNYLNISYHSSPCLLLECIRGSGVPQDHHQEQFPQDRWLCLPTGQGERS